MTTRPTYLVRAERDGAWWGIEVPAVLGAYSQARRLDQVDDMAREVVALLLDVPEDSFDLTVSITVPEQWDGWVAELRAAQERRSAADQEASTTARETARRLRDAGLPVRDVGSLMGISPQRVSQLLAS